MSARTKLTAADLREAMTTFAALLRSHREAINRLNVYPVPDGDTGTNMALTVESVVQALEPIGDDPSMDEVCNAIARGSLMGARGNSGVILSQILRGMVEKMRSAASVTPSILAEALSHADQRAREAVVRPVEGTILSVARAAAQGASSASNSLSHLVHAARDRAREALARTPEQLAVLKDAGVVDSGGTGLVLLFDALCHVVADEPLPEPPVGMAALDLTGVETTSGVMSPRYEVMFLLSASDDLVGGFRQAWEEIGDSIVIVGDEGLYNCHIHTDDIGAAIEAALDAGRPREIRVTDLESQVEDLHHEPNGDALAPTPAPRTSVVAVVAGSGVRQIFRSLGVREVVSGGQSMNPSTAELAEAVQATGSDDVVILPNNKNIVPVARQVDDLVPARVRVVETHSVVEGFAAMLAYHPDEGGEQNAVAMADASHRVVTGEVTRAVRDTTTGAGAVSSGDWIGLDASGVRAIGDSLVDVTLSLLEVLVGDGHELVTLIEGDGVDPSATEAVVAGLRERRPDLGIEVHHGGQPLYPYYVGIE